MLIRHFSLPISINRAENIAEREQNPTFLHICDESLATISVAREAVSRFSDREVDRGKVMRNQMVISRSAKIGRG
jgi:hypothetical protein